MKELRSALRLLLHQHLHPRGDRLQLRLTSSAISSVNFERWIEQPRQGQTEKRIKWCIRHTYTVVIEYAIPACCWRRHWSLPGSQAHLPLETVHYLSRA